MYIIIINICFGLGLKGIKQKYILIRRLLLLAFNKVNPPFERQYIFGLDLKSNQI